jgi:hypothetical protein
VDLSYRNTAALKLPRSCANTLLDDDHPVVAAAVQSVGNCPGVSMVMLGA